MLHNNGYGFAHYRLRHWMFTVTGVSVLSYDIGCLRLLHWMFWVTVMSVYGYDKGCLRLRFSGLNC
jgi:hypothetical protein